MVQCERKGLYAALAVAIALGGCNGEGEKSTDNGSPGYVAPATITAQNAIFITEYQDAYLVDLSDKVSVSDGKSFTLIDVTSLTDVAECQPLETMAQSFTIAAQETKACDYEYKVAVVDASIAATSTASNTLAPASLTGAPTDIAITRVAVASEAPEDVSEATLPAISYVTLMGEQVTVTVDAELLGQAGYVVPDGFSIEPGSVITPYSEGGSIDSVGTHTITYTPRSDFEGIERILFSYISENGSDILLGTLDIAVSSKPNQGITVQEDIIYAPDVHISINELRIIDVSPYVYSIDEAQKLQLIHVDSFNAATAPFDPENLSNTKFTFQTSKMGNHYVSFAVSDNNGAFAMGLMEVPVFDPNNTGQWDDIFHEGLNFTAPLTSQEAAGNQIEYRESRTDDTYSPTVDLALFDTVTAQNYCGTKGRLPTSAELVSLSNYGTTTDGETIRDTDNWPISESYLATNGEGFDTVDMTSGTPSEYMAGNYLVTCVEGGLTVEAPTEDPIANGTDEAVVIFTLLGQDEEPTVGATINFTVQSEGEQASLATLNEATDENGQAIARVTNIKAEEVMVCGEVGIQEACTIATFIGDPATASVVSVTSDVTGWKPGDETFYPVQAKVEDVNGNPVQDVFVARTDVSNAGDVTDGLVWRNLNDNLTNQEGVQEWEVQNKDETSESDITEHDFEHVNTNSNTTNVDHTIYWGVWQWKSPIQLKPTARTWNNPSRPNCNEYGADWYPITDSQIDEYAEAVSDGNPLLSRAQSDPFIRMIEDRDPALYGVSPEFASVDRQIHPGSTVSGYYRFYTSRQGDSGNNLFMDFYVDVRNDSQDILEFADWNGDRYLFYFADEVTHVTINNRVLYGGGESLSKSPGVCVRDL